VLRRQSDGQVGGFQVPSRTGGGFPFPWLGVLGEGEGVSRKLPKGEETITLMFALRGVDLAECLEG